MQVREIDPIHDLGWLHLVESHPRSSVFHTPGWLEALRVTYGYEPVVLSTSPQPGSVDNGVVVCRVSSWLTGRRVVSLPFSDHCQPLVNAPEELRCLLAKLRDEENNSGVRYIELRPAESEPLNLSGFSQSQSFCMHRLDLGPELPEIFRRFHKTCIQRKITRAEREGVVYQEGRSELLLKQFYELMVLTRRRQSLIPQPLAWFRNLIDAMGAKLQLHVVTKGDETLAAMLTLMHRRTIVYKYGASDRRLSHLGGTQLMFWRAIENAKAQGAREFDLGRSDWETPGLIRFKDRWGAARANLTYWRTGVVSEEQAAAGAGDRAARGLVRHLPRGFLKMAGVLMYRHLG